jgi:hypothetical protein
LWDFLAFLRRALGVSFCVFTPDAIKKNKTEDDFLRKGNSQMKFLGKLAAKF